MGFRLILFLSATIHKTVFHNLHLSTKGGHCQRPFDLSAHFFKEAEQREDSTLQNPPPQAEPLPPTSLLEILSGVKWSSLTF